MIKLFSASQGATFGFIGKIYNNYFIHNSGPVILSESSF